MRKGGKEGRFEALFLLLLFNPCHRGPILTVTTDDNTAKLLPPAFQLESFQDLPRAPERVPLAVVVHRRAAFESLPRGLLLVGVVVGGGRTFGLLLLLLLLLLLSDEVLEVDRVDQFAADGANVHPFVLGDVPPVPTLYDDGVERS